MDKNYEDENLVVESNDEIIKVTFNRNGIKWFIDNKPSIQKSTIYQMFNSLGYDILDKFSDIYELKPLVIGQDEPAHLPLDHSVQQYAFMDNHKLSLDKMILHQDVNNKDINYLTLSFSSVHGYYDVHISKFTRKKLFQIVEMDKLYPKLHKFVDKNKYRLKKSIKRLDRYNKKLFTDIASLLVGNVVLDDNDKSILVTTNEEDSLFITEGAFELVGIHNAFYFIDKVIYLRIDFEV